MDAASSTSAAKEEGNSDKTRSEPVANKSDKKTVATTSDEGSSATTGKGEEKMEVESERNVTEGGVKKADGGEKESGKEGEGTKEQKETEPDFEMLSNPARVLPQQVSSFCRLNNLTQTTYSSVPMVPICVMCS